MPATAQQTPAAAEPRDLNTQVALLRQATEQQHGTLLEGQRRIEDSVRGLRDEVSRTYVDKVEFGKLDGRVKGCEDKIVSVDGKVGTLNGYLGWLVKGLVAALMTAGAGLLFAHGGHP